ncbi:YmdB family metallophosphoesterase [bacterium]|nr:YmdB family metallophosphoesterase [bacterium]
MEKLKIYFISDIVGRHGRKITKIYLDELLSEHGNNKNYFVIANVENASGGFGLTEKNYNDLSEYGVDCMTSGNHIWDKREIFNYIENAEKLIRPLNYPRGTHGEGYKIFDFNGVKIAVINLLGQVFMNTVKFYWEDLPDLIEELKKITPIIIIDIHAEATAEKICLSKFAADLGVSAVLGTHTHVQTADERIIDNHTGAITDVGFTGAHEGVIGMEYRTSISRFTTCMPDRFEVSMDENAQMNAVELVIDTQSGVCESIKRINFIKNIKEGN